MKILKISEQIIDFKSDDNSEDVNDSKEENDKEKYCLNYDILNNNCANITIKDEQIMKIYDIIKNEYIKKNKTEKNIIITKNVIFEITNSNKQKISLNQNVSSIDLGECENKLKEKYNILETESLIIFKTDSKNEDSKITHVQYEIYNPNTLEQLNLSICQDYHIIINIPILLDSEIELLYQSLNESGYNLFNANDSFYNDICTPLKTEKNIDIIIGDRRNYFQNLTLYQTGCTFQSYNTTTKKSNCKCGVENKNIYNNANNVKFYTKKLKINFLNSLKKTNLIVLVCHNLLLDISKLVENIGFITMTTLLLLSIILIFIHYIKYQKNIQSFINSTLRIRFIYDKKDNNTMKNINKENSKLKKNSTFIKRKKKRISFLENQENQIIKKVLFIIYIIILILF